MGIPSYFHKTIGYSNEGDVPLDKRYMVAFDDKVICVLTNSLEELNEYLCEYHKGEFEQGFAIIDVTEMGFKISADRVYLTSVIDKLSEIIPSLSIEIKE